MKNNYNFNQVFGTPIPDTNEESISDTKRTFSLKRLLLLMLFFSFASIMNAQNVTVNPGTGSYPTLKDAFDAINLGTHTGAITIDIVGNTSETASAVLNASGTGASSYTSITIAPSGGAARTITGAVLAGTPLIDFNGADNVIIDGLNTGGNTLTISNTTVSATSITSTIRFIGGATSNTITNCNLQGSASMSVATNGGVIFFSTDALTANGNDNNTISNNNIGPAGTNLPTKAIYSNGSTTTTAIGNSGNIISNNDIHDYFGAAVTSSGISLNGGNNTWTITNNRLYQTGTRTWTTGATHRGIEINSTTTTSGNQGHTITFNTVGYASNTQTGVYTLTGSTGKFHGIAYNGITTGTLSTVSNNTVAAVNMSGVTSSGTSTSSPFTAILLQNGLVTSNDNIIGSNIATGSLVFSTTTTTTTDIYGMYNFSSDDWTANNNSIGGISVTNLGASGTFIIYGMRANTSTTKASNLTLNLIGGTVANSIQLTATGVSSQIIGFQTPNSNCNLSRNSIRNLTTNIGTGTTTSASVIGICLTSTTPNHNISENNIYNLKNSNTSAASVVTGIQFTGGTGANVVQRNNIRDLTVDTNSATAEVNGIRVAGGTTIYRNNMIHIAGNTNAVQVNGFNEALGTNTIYNNSIYVGGNPVAGTANSYAFNGSQTVNVRSFRNNIFYNGRNNIGATGKNYAVKVGGTGVNPTGLTINNNVYFANGTGGIFGFYGADVLNLTDWQTAVGQDANSIEANPMFISAIDNSLQTGSPAIDTAADLGITNDFTGDSRPGLNALYDIGADEKDGIPLAVNDIQATTFVNPANAGTKLVSVAFAPQASFINNGTANQTSVTVRYRILDAAMAEVYNQTATISTLNAFASTTVTFPNATISTAGVYTIYAKAELVGDTVITNDEINGTLNILTPLAGTYTVGTAGDYTSLTNPAGIFDALNNLGASANITINIISDLTAETGAVMMNELAGGYTTLIQPLGAARTITGTINGALIKFNGADNVTINGSTTGSIVAPTLVGGDAALRELTIQNTNVGTSAGVVSFQSGTNGAMNNTIKNVNAYGQDPTTTLIGIAFGGNTLGTAGTDNDNNKIENCAVQKAIFGIYSAGLSLANQNQNTIIKNNDISATTTNRIRRVGVLLFNDNNGNVSYNSVGGIDNSGESSDAIGLAIGIQGLSNTTVTSGAITNCLITNNKINGVVNDATYSAAGITIAGDTGGANTISNNMISGVISDGNSGDFPSGIFVSGFAGSNTKIYHNTVSMSGDRSSLLTPGTTMYPSYAIAITGTDPAVDIQNNIFTNSQIATVASNADAKSYAIGTMSTTFVNLTSNYNDFVSTGIQDGGFRSGSLATAAGTNYATVALWSATTNKDANSVEIDPVFTSASDLHITQTVANNAIDNLGTPLASITIDYDGATRNATTPDMGADEFCTPPAAPTGTAAQSFCNTTPTVADLTATGTAIKWYAAATGGTALVSTDALVSGNHYFASQTISGCESDARYDVTVTITTALAPIGLATQIYAGTTTTIADLIVTGTAIQWYDAVTAGTVLPTSTVLVDGTTYFASQTISGCESTRLAVTVRKISDATQTLCGPATVANLVSTPSAGQTAQWFSVATGGTVMLGTDAISTGNYYVQETAPPTITIGSGFNKPYGVAIQADGKILVADTFNNSIKRMNADGTGIVTLATGLNGPSCIFEQTDGKIVFTDSNNNAIKRMNADGTGIVSLGTSFLTPDGIALQADGKIIVADSGNNSIKRMDADGTNVTTLVTGLNYPVGLAIEADGKILIADYLNNAVKRMNADGTGIVAVGGFFNNPLGVSVQADGKILIALAGGTIVQRMNADGTGLVTLPGSYNQPSRAIQRADGAIIVADTYNNAIKVITEGVSNRVFVAVTVNEPAAPTGTAAQSFCNAATVADLAATGTAIQWYAAATGGTALVSTDVLVSGNHYFASQTISGCESASRFDVTATINTTAAPTGTAAQSFCNAATVANLTATGTAIQWYAAATGGTALASTDALVSGNHYFASQTISGCESATRFDVTVSFSTVAPITITPSPAAFCLGSIQPLVATSTSLPVTGTIGTATTFTGATAQPTAFCNRWPNYWSQTIYTAADLTAAGLTAGNITSLAYNISSLGDAATNANLTLKIGTVAGTNFASTTFLPTTGFTTVYGPSTYTHTSSGWQTITFSTPYVWDGVSNIIINMTHDGADNINNSQTFFTATTDNKTLWKNSYTGTTTTGTLSVNRLNIRFVVGPPATCTWSPITNLFTDAAATVPYTALANATTVYSKPTTAGTTTYTALVTNGLGCTGSQTVDVTANALPVLIVTNPAAVCAPATVDITAAAVTAGSDAGLTLTYYTNASATVTYATPTAATAGTYYIKAVNASSCVTIMPVVVTVNPTPSAITFTPASPTTVCAGTIQSIVANGGSISTSGTATIGTATTLTGAATEPTAFSNRWKHSWQQMVFTPAELSAQGLTAGANINSLTLGITTLGDGTNVTDLKIYMGTSATATLTGFASTGLTQVFSAATYTHAVGNNTMTFQTPYIWDGTSNVIVDIRQTGQDSSNNSQTYYTATTGNTVVWARTSTTAASSDAYAATNPAATTSTQRLNSSFGWTKVIPTSITWSPTTNLYTDAAATVAYTGTGTNTVYFKSSTAATTTYTATATAGSCTSTAMIDVTVSTTAAPTGTAAQSFCNAATVANLTAIGTAIQWYAAATGGTPLASTTALVDGTHYYASQTISGCESASRFEVTVTVNSTNTIVLSSAVGTDNQTVNAGNSIINITYSTTGATGATVTGLPAGLTGTWAGSTVTISGSVGSCSVINYTVTLTGGCGVVTAMGTINVGTAAPTGTAAQTFCTGETVGQIVVTGTGIVWYDMATGGTVVPNSTLLVSGTTYYASQTVSGCESPTRLAVTMTTGSCLGTNEFDITSFRYYPNPTTDILNISYSETLTSIKVTNMLGQHIFTKTVNATETTIDMSNLPTGTYFVEVVADKASKVVKVIKK